MSTVPQDDYPVVLEANPASLVLIQQLDLVLDGFRSMRRPLTLLPGIIMIATGFVVGTFFVVLLPCGFCYQAATLMKDSGIASLKLAGVSSVVGKRGAYWISGFVYFALAIPFYWGCGPLIYLKCLAVAVVEAVGGGLHPARMMGGLIVVVVQTALFAMWLYVPYHLWQLYAIS